MRTVAIVGACSTYRLAPYQDPAIEIWGIGRHLTRYRRVTRVFEMHARAIWEPYLRVTEHRYALDLAGAGCPVYMREQHADIPNSVAFPLDQVIAAIGDYFVCSFSYMLGLAIAEGVDRLELYGINLTAAEEYVYQRANVEHLLGIAKGRGVDVWVHHSSPLLKAGLRYGTEEWFQAGADRTAKSRFKIAELMGGANAARHDSGLDARAARADVDSRLIGGIA